MNKEEDEHNSYNEAVDYNASQELVSFGTKVGVKTRNNEGENSDSMLEENLRRCGRLADKQDANIEGLAKERAATKDNYGKEHELDFHNASIIHGRRGWN